MNDKAFKATALLGLIVLTATILPPIFISCINALAWAGGANFSIPYTFTTHFCALAIIFMVRG